MAEEAEVAESRTSGSAALHHVGQKGRSSAALSQWGRTSTILMHSK